MTHVRFILILLLGVSLAGAQDGPADPLLARSHVAAAALAAEQTLVEDIRLRTLPGGGTVGEFIDHADAAEALRVLASQSEQVGGPRWIDPDTCQVRRQLPARKVRDLLVRSAADPAHALAAGVELAEALASWDDQVFTAVGTSMSPAAIASLAPRSDPEWLRVPEPSRRRTIAQAHAAAVAVAMQRLEAIRLADDTSLRQRLGDDAALAASLKQWVEQRPVTAVSFDRGTTVAVTIAMPPEDVADFLRAGDASPATLPDGLAFVSATATAPPPATAAQTPVNGAGPNKVLPTRPYVADRAQPEWARQLYLVEGTSPSVGTRLRTARAAEDVARQRLREQVRDLPIAEGRTVADVMQLGEARVRGIDRVLSTASTTRITYHADGSATVQMMIDGRALWQAVAAD
jgi:hypothetical protein